MKKEQKDTACGDSYLTQTVKFQKLWWCFRSHNPRQTKEERKGADAGSLLSSFLPLRSKAFSGTGPKAGLTAEPRLTENANRKQGHTKWKPDKMVWKQRRQVASWLLKTNALCWKLLSARHLSAGFQQGPLLTALLPPGGPLHGAPPPLWAPRLELRMTKAAVADTPLGTGQEHHYRQSHCAILETCVAL